MWILVVVEIRYCSFFNFSLIVYVIYLVEICLLNGCLVVDIVLGVKDIVLDKKDIVFV